MRAARAERRDGRWAAVMIFPNLAMFSVFIIVPVLGGLYLSFTTWDITNGFPKWVGLQNYRQMFHDPLVWQASRPRSSSSLSAWCRR